MARRKLIEYLNDPLLLNEISIKEMKAWAKEVPYAGLVHRLLAQKIAMEEVATEEMERANTLAILTSANPEKTIQSIEDFKKLMLRSTDEVNNELIPMSPPLNEGPEDEVLNDNMQEATDLEELDTTEGAQEEHVIRHLEESKADFDLPSIVDTQGEIGSTENGISASTEKVDTIDEIKNDEQIVSIESEEENDEDEEEYEVPHVDPESQELLDMDVINEPSPSSAAVSDESGFSEWLKSLRPLAIKEERNQDNDDNSAVSETLASLLVKQGHKKRAIDMYQKLILKYPGKSSFFAAQIAKLKDG